MDTLLLVDDEVSILKSIQRIFMEDDTIEVLTASSAKEAGVILAQRPVDIIISDERMPQISGTEFLRFAREHYPNIQRIILTGYASQEATINAINKAEVFRFLTKPWDPAELVTTVKHALQMKVLRDTNGQLNTKIQAQNEALEKANASLEQKVAERTDQLRKTLETLKTQNKVLKNQRTGVVELLVSLAGQYDRTKGKTARQVWESIRLYAESNDITLSDEMPFAAMLKVFVDPDFASGDDTFLKLLSSIEGFASIAALILESHEQINGQGPAGKKDQEITFDARLLRIASDYYLLNPDKPKVSRNFILNELNKIYDPDLAPAFLLSCRDDYTAAYSYNLEIDDLLPGMVTCKDIALVNGAILLPAGTSFNETMIVQLKKVQKLVKSKIEIYSELERKQ